MLVRVGKCAHTLDLKNKYYELSATLRVSCGKFWEQLFTFHHVVWFCSSEDIYHHQQKSYMSFNNVQENLIRVCWIGLFHPIAEFFPQGQLLTTAAFRALRATPPSPTFPVTVLQSGTQTALILLKHVLCCLPAAGSTHRPGRTLLTLPLSAKKTRWGRNTNYM